MRSLLAILAITFMPAAVVMFWMRSQPDPALTTFQPRSVVWADRVFTRPAELRRWLRARGERYDVWARTHPSQAAILEHRRPPRAAATQSAKPPTPSQAGKAARRAGRRSDRAGWVVAAAEILAALLAISATAGLALRAGRRVRLPRIRPPTVNLDLRPLVDGVGNAATRLAHVRLPDLPSLRTREPPSERVPSQETLIPSEDGGLAPAAVAESLRNGHRTIDRPLPVVEPETVVADVPSLTPAAVATPAALLETPAVADGTWELCTTACWRGYVTARFYAHPPGNDVSLGQSESFDWWAWQDVPRNQQAAEAALAALRARLERDGWEPIGRGGAWYEVRFRRRPRPEW